MKIAMSADTTKTVGISATMLSNYGTVTMVFYALEEDFNSASTYFNQIIDSFNFDKDYRYINLPEERSDKMFGILPKSLPSLALLLMAIFLYGKHFNWRKFRETRVYFIKETVAILFAVILNRLSVLLYSSEVSHDFIDMLEIILTIVVGVIWYKEYKKINKRNPFSWSLPAENLKKNEILKVSSKDGFWTCPSCNERNKEIQDACSNCGQEIEKT
jgi:hypothetical protein